MEPKTAAVIVAAGRGSRMKSDIPKQYLLLKGKPILCHTVQAFLDLDGEYRTELVVLVVSPGEEEYVRTEILEAYGIRDGRIRIVPGGKERHDSVYQGLLACQDADCSIVMIHDGARPLITPEVMKRTIEGALECGAAVAAVPVKDTIKVADDSSHVKETLDRSRLWAVQTPQTFLLSEIREAHERYQKEGLSVPVTDDAMMVEQILKKPVRLVMGDYRNQKVTTPEDLAWLSEIF